MTAKTIRNWLRKALAFVAFFCVPAVLLVVIAQKHEQHQQLRDEIAKLEKRRDDLQLLADRFRDDERAAYGAKRTLWSLLREAREAGDIPNLGGNRIISDHRGTDVLSIYVPRGNHSLEIKAKWGPRTGWLTQPPQDGSAKEPAPEMPTGERSWSVPLRSESGYWLETIARRRAGQLASQADRVNDFVQWMLTSSHPDFKPQREELPIEGFKQSGASWSGSGIVAFPNQIESQKTGQLKAPVASPEGVKLMTTKLLGRWQDEQFEVAFDVRLVSDGPAVVAASDAIRLVVLKRDQLLERDEGDGSYAVRGEDP